MVKKAAHHTPHDLHEERKDTVGSHQYRPIVLNTSDRETTSYGIPRSFNLSNSDLVGRRLLVVRGARSGSSFKSSPSIIEFRIAIEPSDENTEYDATRSSDPRRSRKSFNRHCLHVIVRVTLVLIGDGTGAPKRLHGQRCSHEPPPA